MSKHDDIMRGMGLHGQAIVATLEILADQDRTGPDLERVAHRLGVPVDDLRRIFPTEQSLLVAVAEQALVRLMDTCTKAVVRVEPEDAVAQFLALGSAYVRWATEHPLQFWLITGHPSLNTLQQPELRRYLDSIADLMTRMLERARKAGRLRADEDIPMMVLSSRIFAYGLARMVIDGRMEDCLPSLSPQDAAEVAMADFVHRFARGSAPRTAAQAR